ncbi:MAG TPA: hypothetical protein VHF22_07780, partial [Planctomycetota bacterium]|nr:hypothetical protein [Planctomycetota bacterium]
MTGPMRQTLALVLLLIAGALGFVHGAWRYNAERTAAEAEESPRTAPPAATHAASDASPSGASTAAPARPKAAAAPAEPKPEDLSEQALAAARAARDQGDKAVKAGDYEAAQKAYAEAARKVTGATSVVAPALAKAIE